LIFGCIDIFNDYDDDGGGFLAYSSTMKMDAMFLRKVG
jgi:hypothetical protein